ncbi:MAG: hypothetical protein ACXWT0_00260 [Methylobacter sp.]
MTATANIQRQQQRVAKESTKEAGLFVEQLRESVVNTTGTFDSAAAGDFLGEALSSSSIKVPETLQALLEELPADKSGTIMKAVLDGVNNYESEHGIAAPADLIEQAFHMAYATTDNAKSKYSLDSASNAHGDQLSLQPNRAQVAILTAFAEAIPFAHYLPADIGSNEAKLAILSHQAGVAYGMYAAGGSMDGVSAGDPFITAKRIDKVTVAAAAIPTGQLSSVQATRDTCAAVAGSVVAVNLLRGRSQVYIGGKVVAREVTSNQSGTGNSTIAGSVTIASTTYTLSGTINTDTGAHALASSPMLPNGTDIFIEGFIDYERQPGITPNMMTVADTFSLFATPWRVITQSTPDALSQMANELKIDPYSESVMAIQRQFAIERHYEVLHKALRLGANNTGAFDMAWATQGTQKTRAQVIQDMQTVLGAVSQKMAEDTLGYGVSHLYVGKYMMSQLQSLPRDIWQSSGLQNRPGIFRIGRLFGLYDVYYSPKIIADSNSASQILAIGRADDVARNPFVLGDALAPTVTPLAVGTDLKRGAGFYARNFTEVNPHSPSASGCALISVTNIGA